MSKGTHVSSKKAGRPAKARTIRISPRFPENVAETLQRAADLRGVSVASFVVDSAQRAAKRIIEEDTRWRLDEAETSKLAALLGDPPPRQRCGPDGPSPGRRCRDSFFFKLAR